jgi:hypothetical protein
MIETHESYKKAKAYVDQQLALSRNGRRQGISKAKYRQVILRVIRATPRSKGIVATAR